MLCSFVHLSMCIMWHLANILLYLCRGDGVLLLQLKKEACMPVALHQLLAGTIDHGELMLPLKLILVFLFSVWAKCCSIQRLTALCFFSCCLIAKLYPSLCDPVDYSMVGFSVLHYLLKFTQTHVHWVDDAIQPSHPLSPSSPTALNLSQHQSLFSWVGSLH